MPSDMKTIGEFLQSPDWAADEKAVIEWQFRLCGDFKTALWQAIVKADENNLKRLAKGFPMEVSGYRKWTETDLGQRLRDAGLGI